MGNQLEYYRLGAEEIYNDINGSDEKLIQSEVEGIKFEVFPHVYPSHKFRTTGFVLQNLKSVLQGRKVCDMGCGPGIVGIYALKNGANEVIQADINPFAVANAKQNNKLHGFSDQKIQTFQSDCFENIPKTDFDIIVFNMPYHSDQIKIEDPLKYAFYDPGFVSIGKFLKQAKNFSHETTQIFIAFSNKGQTVVLEKIFEENQYNWELWKITNTDQEYDNRICRLTKI